jgi:hypothetical protein
MISLFREATKSSPEIDFNAEKGLLKLSGQSYPENAFKFYEEVFEWLNNYFESADCNTVIDINLVYINTSSTKCIMDIMYKVEEVVKNGKIVTINWYYNSRNRNIYECGEELKEDMDINFNLIKVE